MGESFGQLKPIVAVVGLVTVATQGAVIFTDIPDIPFFLVDYNSRYPVNLNSDGVDDAFFRNFGQEFAVFSTSTSTIAGIAATPPDQNSFAAAFESGSIIGPSFTNLYTWNTGYSGLISCRTFGVDESYCLGLWGSKEAYIGVQFDSQGTTHFGWILVDTPFDFGGGTIKAFAYETEPGKAIFAGSIPEPSGVILIGTGSILLLARRKRPSR